MIGTEQASTASTPHDCYLELGIQGRNTYPRTITEAPESSGHSQPREGDPRRPRQSMPDDGIQAEELWGRPCLAYNLQVFLPIGVRQELVSIQDRFADFAGLLRVPPPALHATVGWLLEVRTTYPADKEALWRRHGERWRSALEETISSLSQFEIVYRSLLLSTRAIVVVVEPVDAVTVLRRKLVEQLDLPAETPSQPELLHTTLYRYAYRLSHFARM